MADKIEVRCPTCGGVGTVPKVFNEPMAIHPWPRETCRTCSGTGWVYREWEPKRDA